MKRKKGRPVLLCVLVADKPRAPEPGSIKRECEACGEPVWITKTILSEIFDVEGRADAFLTCAPCLIDAMKERGIGFDDIAYKNATPEQAARIREAVRRMGHDL